MKILIEKTVFQWCVDLKTAWKTDKFRFFTDFDKKLFIYYFLILILMANFVFCLKKVQFWQIGMISENQPSDLGQKRWGFQGVKVPKRNISPVIYAQNPSCGFSEITLRTRLILEESYSQIRLYLGPFSTWLQCHITNLTLHN